MAKKSFQKSVVSTYKINCSDADVDAEKDCMKNLQASLENLKAGRVQRFASVDELLKELDRED